MIMSRHWLIAATAACLAATAHGAITLSHGGKTEYVIVVDSSATAPEKRAAKELGDVLKQITGAEFRTQEAGETVPDQAILVGPGAAARQVFADVPFDGLGSEEFVIKTRQGRLLLAGGRARGTLYAVSRFLQDQCGVRWWTPWASRIPANPDLTVGDLDVRARPAFEARDPFWFPAFQPDWAVRHLSNSQSAGLTEEQGGCIRYKGFVHTFYSLVPPDPYFAQHPEWFSLRDGKRTAEHAQLCLTNPALRDFVVERVRQWLRESPDASIVSVSQNDWYGECQCPECKALDDAEGSHSGTLVAFVNAIAERIEPNFPHVAIDTLAYQYTRKPPKTLRPRPNVIIRLCSIECNFREPLEHASNVAFADDIRGWSQICNRLYIWDYTTNFSHYIQPHPNWSVLGSNLRFFQQHHVRGVFEQGAYQSFGSEMAELRAWVLAQLLWNPAQDDHALIDEFLEGYYGKAAPVIRRYMELMHEASRGVNMTCFASTDMPQHRFATLSQAERLWQEAEQVAADDPELLARVRLGHLPVRYVWLTRWSELRKECQESGAQWPLPASRKEVADQWLAVAQGVPGKAWTVVTHVNESGLKPADFVKRFAQDP
jgi:hypothetical protein